MPFSGKAGDTVRLSDSGGGHRWVLLTNSNDGSDVVVACFTAATYWKESLVTFQPKDNRRLFQKKTTIQYGYTRIVRIKELTSKAQRDSADYVFCNENHVMEIIIGAFISEHTPTGIQKELVAHYPTLAEDYYTP